MVLLPDTPSPDALPPNDEALTKQAHKKILAPGCRWHLQMDSKPGHPTYPDAAQEPVQRGAVCKLLNAKVP